MIGPRARLRPTLTEPPCAVWMPTRQVVGAMPVGLWQVLQRTAMSSSVTRLSWYVSVPATAAAGKAVSHVSELTVLAVIVRNCPWLAPEVNVMIAPSHWLALHVCAPSTSVVLVEPTSTMPRLWPLSFKLPYAMWQLAHVTLWASSCGAAGMALALRARPAARITRRSARLILMASTP